STNATSTLPSLTACAFAASFGARLRSFSLAGVAASAAEGQVERIRLPDVVKKRFMEVYLRDVHPSLFNVSFSPRPGVRYAVQGEIRGRLVRALQEGAAACATNIDVSKSGTKREEKTETLSQL